MITVYISPPLYNSDICESSLRAQIHVQVEDKIIYEKNKKLRYWRMTWVKNETREGGKEGEWYKNL